MRDGCPDSAPTPFSFGPIRPDSGPPDRPRTRVPDAHIHAGKTWRSALQASAHARREALVRSLTLTFPLGTVHGSFGMRARAPGSEARHQILALQQCRPLGPERPTRVSAGAPGALGLQPARSAEYRRV